MNLKKIMLYIDLAFCFVFLPLLTILLPMEKLLIHHQFFILVLGLYLLCIYFINRKFNIPALFLNRNFFLGISLIIFMTFVTYLMTHFPFPDPPIKLTEMQIKMRSEMRAQMIWFLYLVVMGFCFSFGLLTELFRQRVIKQEIEAEKNRAEIALYKAQINPHFLFNTLNTLYGLAIVQSENMESAFIKFSDILKYMYSNAQKDTISIDEEINYISQYIDLQRLRLNEHTTVSFTHEIDNGTTQIPPMVLITFVENAFKYGVSSSCKSNIDIAIKVKDGKLYFMTKNPIVSSGDKSIESVGINNCRKRLELLYCDSYSLDINEANGLFLVELNLNLSK